MLSSKHLFKNINLQTSDEDCHFVMRIIQLEKYTASASDVEMIRTLNEVEDCLYLTPKVKIRKKMKIRRKKQ